MSIPYPNILDRKNGLVLLGFNNTESITSYRLFASNSVNNAYGAFNGVPGVLPAAPFLDRLGRTETRMSRDIQLRHRNLGTYGSLNSQTRYFYNPDEFAPANHPPDSQVAFIRVQVATVSSPTPWTFPVPDPNTMSDIRVLVPPLFFSFATPQLSIGGTAPNLAAATFGLPPPSGTMNIRFPVAAFGLNLINHGPGDLFYTLDPGLPLVKLISGDALSITTGLKDNLILCANGANPVFSASLTTTAYGGR